MGEVCLRTYNCSEDEILTQAYDQHLNMILGNVEETVTTAEIDDETYEEIVKVSLCLCPQILSL